MTVHIKIEEGLSSKQTTGDNLILVIYDTAIVRSYNKGLYDRNWRHYGNRTWYVPAKYGLGFEKRAGMGTDSGIFADIRAYKNKYMYQTIWFDCIRDLPEAIKKLKEKFPEADLPSQVDYIIDFPLRRDSFEPGSTLVEPRPPKAKKCLLPSRHKQPRC